MVWARFRRDRRGASMVTFALILPLFILLVFGILEVWRMVSVRQSLHLGTYQAIRALSSTGRQWLPRSAGQWQAMAAGQAETIIEWELQRNSLLPANHDLQVQVTIDGAAPANLSELGWLFTVQAQLNVEGLVTLPWLDVGALTLTERQVSYIEGITGDWSPPVEGKPY